MKILFLVLISVILADPLPTIKSLQPNILGFGSKEGMIQVNVGEVVNRSILSYTMFETSKKKTDNDGLY